MKIIYARLIGLMLFATFVLCACGYKHKVEWQGQYLYIDSEKYIDAGGLYNESNIKIGKSNGFTIYEVVGDKEHNYVVSRSFLDQRLYVKESYAPDKTAINAVCFSGYIDDCLYDEKIIDCISSFESDIESDGESINGNDELLQLIRDEGKPVYVLYGGSAVGEFIGYIFTLDNQYMYYNYSRKMMIEITDEQLEFLLKYL